MDLVENKGSTCNDLGFGWVFFKEFLKDLKALMAVKGDEAQLGEELDEAALACE